MQSSSEQQEKKSGREGFAAYINLLIDKKIGLRDLSAGEIVFRETYENEHKIDAELAQKKVSKLTLDSGEVLKRKRQVEQEVLESELNTKKENLKMERDALSRRREERALKNRSVAHL